MRLLPASRLGRFAAYCAICILAAAVLWTWVFPWVDRNFVNDPALEEGAALVRALAALV